jgi:hypothetical protein
MSSESPVVANASADLTVPSSSGGEDGDASAALLTRGDNESAAFWANPTIPPDSPFAGLPLQLDVTVPIPSFRVDDLLALEKGAVLESQWPHTEDVPVWCGGTQLAWTEFEVVEQKLAVRLTRVS